MILSLQANPEPRLMNDDNQQYHCVNHLCWRVKNPYCIDKPWSFHFNSIANSSEHSNQSIGMSSHSYSFLFENTSQQSIDVILCWNEEFFSSFKYQILYSILCNHHGIDDTERMIKMTSDHHWEQCIIKNEIWQTSWQLYRVFEYEANTCRDSFHLDMNHSESLFHVVHRIRVLFLNLS